jgi:hypothetical protein
MNDDLNNFLMGAIAVAYATVSLFFARFWYRTGDRLFILFAISFGLLSAIRVGLFAFDDISEDHVLYWLRFAAYVLILVAIIDKNRGK